MNGVKRALRPAARSIPVRRARRLLGRVGAPGLNPELELLHRRIDGIERSVGDLSRTNPRLDALELVVGQLQRAVGDLQQRLDTVDRHLPGVLNAVASTNGTARLLRRELDAVIERTNSAHTAFADESSRLSGEVAGLTADVVRMGDHIRDELWPLQAKAQGLDGLYQTAEWLTHRIETVRAEMLHELRYGPAKRQPERVEARIVDASALSGDGSLPRLNLGCGHVALNGYVNVDVRELPGVDVVAPVDSLPFGPDGVAEIFSAHVLEHFPQVALERQLLPYWFGLLAPGGTFRAVVPDVDAMFDQYRAGEISFDNLREVVYGGQEYDGDFHHTAFTPASLAALLEAAGFVDTEVIARGRVNGACLEFEIEARRPG